MCTATIRGEKGLIYGVPRDFRTKHLLQIDPIANTTAIAAFDDVDAHHTKWFSRILPSGKEVLCCPISHSHSEVAIQIADPTIMLSWTRGKRGKDGFIIWDPCCS
jgi:hypothetical protein